MTTYEKIVKGATKLKLAAPKAKYIEPILIVTHSARDFHDEDLKAIMKTLATRIQDSAWTVVFKSLLVIHIMIREGEGDLTLQYLAHHYKMLEPHNVSKSGNNSGGLDVRALKTYARYLISKAKEYGLTKVDYVRDERLHNAASRNPESGGRLRRLSVDKGILREVESVQRQIDSLLHCRFQESEVNNDVVLTAFRMLVHDLLSLYQSLNEGVINLLEHYFEMSKYDAGRALDIYKIFVDQTKDVVAYLRIAKHLEYATKLHVPTIKHAPTALANSLEEYLNDDNFEVNRRQYLAEKEVKDKGGSSLNLIRKDSTSKQQSPQAVAPPPPQAAQDLENRRQSELIMQQQSGFNPWGFPLQGDAATAQQQAVLSVFQPQTAQTVQNQQFAQPAQQIQQVQPVQPVQQIQQIQQIQPVQATQAIPQDQSIQPVQQAQQLQSLQQQPTNFGFSNQPSGFVFANNSVGGASALLQSNPTGGAQMLIPVQKTGGNVQQSDILLLSNGFSVQANTAPLTMSTGTAPQSLDQQTTGFFSQRPNSTIIPAFTGTGFGGYGSQNLEQQATGNPFLTSPNAGINNGFTTAPNTFSSIQINQTLKPQYTSSQTTLDRTLTNPFSLGNIPEKQPEAQPKQVDPTANPFSSTAPKRNTISLEAMHTGTNPFSRDVNVTGQQTLRPQATAGGLERLSTIPVFPETQKDFSDQQLQLNARSELEQHKLIQQQQQQQQQYQQTGYLQQQATGFQQQQQQQQPTGYLQQQATGFQQQQPVAHLQHQPTNIQIQVGFQPQPTQSQPTGIQLGFSSFTNGPQQSMATGNPFLPQPQQFSTAANPFMGQN